MKTPKKLNEQTSVKENTPPQRTLSKTISFKSIDSPPIEFVCTKNLGSTPIQKTPSKLQSLFLKPKTPRKETPPKELRRSESLPKVKSTSFDVCIKNPLIQSIFINFCKEHDIYGKVLKFFNIYRTNIFYFKCTQI